MNCETEYRVQRLGKGGHSQWYKAFTDYSGVTSYQLRNNSIGPIECTEMEDYRLASNNDVVTYLRMQRPLIEQYSHAWWMNLTCIRLALLAVTYLRYCARLIRLHIIWRCSYDVFREDQILRQYGTKEGGTWEITMRCRKARKYLRRTFTYGISKTAELLSSWPWRAPMYT